MLFLGLPGPGELVAALVTPVWGSTVSIKTLVPLCINSLRQYCWQQAYGSHTERSARGIIKKWNEDYIAAG